MLWIRDRIAPWEKWVWMVTAVDLILNIYVFVKKMSLFAPFIIYSDALWVLCLPLTN